MSFAYLCMGCDRTSMKSVELVIRNAEEVVESPVYASSRVERELVFEGQGGEGVETVLSYVEGDPEPYEAAFRDAPGVQEFEITRDGDTFLLYLRRELNEEGQWLMDALGQETVVLVPPIEFRSDGSMHLALVGGRTDLQAVVEALGAELDVDVARVAEYGAVAGPSARLTDRQREALAAAWGVGYYDVPREAGIEAVADELDCSLSTASGLLRRAEARLVGDALGKQE